MQQMNPVSMTEPQTIVQQKGIRILLSYWGSLSWLATLAFVLMSCGDSSSTVVQSVNRPPATASSFALELERVTDIHGGAGPWAVVGYRMGKRALAELGLQSEIPHTSQNRFAINVVHKAPMDIQFTSIVDGLHAGTGASLGKMNLSLVNVPTVTEMRSIVSSKQTNKTIEFQVTPTFLSTYRDLPFERLLAAGEEVIRLPDEAIFTFTVTTN
jgi:formylmethanofuran dehydrogenase subunit E